MPKGRFREEQIIGILREAKAGRTLKDRCRDHGASQETFSRWRREVPRHGGLGRPTSRAARG